MRIIRHLKDVHQSPSGRIVAIGNFDGLHLGHQALLHEARRLADDHGCLLAVLSFHPHPVDVFDPEGPPRRLSSIRQKYQLISALGADELILLPFNRHLISMTAHDFIDTILDQGLQARCILTGDDFRFGHKRQGTIETLQHEGALRGIQIYPQTLQGDADHQLYSSTAVREALSQGRIVEAAAILGRQYQYQGRVVKGDQRGRELGYPTANVSAPARQRLMTPAPGIYAVRMRLGSEIDAGWHDGVASLGYRPTFEGEDFRTEVHLFDFNRSIYGERVDVAFVDRLRGELKFEGIDSLIRQMDEDSRRARQCLAEHPTRV